MVSSGAGVVFWQPEAVDSSRALSMKNSDVVHLVCFLFPAQLYHMSLFLKKIIIIKNKKIKIKIKIKIVLYVLSLFEYYYMI